MIYRIWYIWIVFHVRIRTSNVAQAHFCTYTDDHNHSDIQTFRYTVLKTNINNHKSMAHEYDRVKNSNSKQINGKHKISRNKNISCTNNKIIINYKVGITYLPKRSQRNWLILMKWAFTQCKLTFHQILCSQLLMIRNLKKNQTDRRNKNSTASSRSIFCLKHCIKKY